METLQTFLTIFIPLLIIMDPFGNLPLFLLFTKHNTPEEQNRTAAFSTMSAAFILVLFGLTGDFILRFFGISLPAFQLAGGFIFFIYALQMLQLLPSSMKTTTEEEREGVTKENVALVPLATPMLAGPGAITAVLVWKENPDHTVDPFSLFSAIIISCLIAYVVFRFGKLFSRIMGVGGIKVTTRLMGLLLSVIAVQFMLDGLHQLQL